MFYCLLRLFIVFHVGHYGDVGYLFIYLPEVSNTRPEGGGGDWYLSRTGDIPWNKNILWEIILKL